MTGPIKVEVQRACGRQDDAEGGWLCRPWACSRPEECPLPDAERSEYAGGPDEGVSPPVGADYLRTLLAPEGAERCGASCACHVPEHVRCGRPAGHAHGDTVTRSDGSPDVRTEPHIGLDADGSLVQWTHVEAEHGPVKSADVVAEETAAARRAHTYALLDSLDHDILREITTQSSVASVDHDGSA